MVGKHEPSQASKAPLRCAKEGRERQYLTSENTCILRIQQQQNEQNSHPCVQKAVNKENNYLLLIYSS